jgi:D-arabinitol dehydrogenase (NADP+)
MQVEATGSEKVANAAIHYVRRGGTLMIYGVYSNSSLVHWAPSKIFSDEINVSSIGHHWQRDFILYHRS